MDGRLSRPSARAGPSPRARVLLGVTGGIAAYKACELVRLLVTRGYEVVPALTPEAERFVAARTFEALARREAPRQLYPHLAEADVLVVAPCTANTLAKLALGLADNLLTEAALAHSGPVVVAPAMNARMWEHPATRENVARLRERGAEIVGPDTGELAEGEFGAGRMAAPEEIATRVQALLSRSLPDVASFHGRRVLVTAGGTREPLDSVRFVGNRSSGRMGVALAAEARRRGADVTLVYANGSVRPPPGVEVVETVTAADLARETLARRRRDGQVLVGFAADEGEEGLARAREKLARKGGTFFVFNDVSRSDVGFESEENEVILVSPRGERRVPRRSKEEVSAAILDEVATFLEGP